MQSYTIKGTGRNQTYRLTEAGGYVSSSSIDFFVGFSFSTIRSMVEQKGWVIIPDMEEPANVFEFRGSRYELQWNKGAIVSITKDGEEISWHEMPEQLKGLL